MSWDKSWRFERNLDVSRETKINKFGNVNWYWVTFTSVIGPIGLVRIIIFPHHAIELFPESLYLTNIVTEFGKFRYNMVLIVLCASGDNFQAKLYEILGDINGVKTYINDVLVIIKGSLSWHIDHLKFIFFRMCNVELSVCL